MTPWPQTPWGGYAGLNYRAARAMVGGEDIRAAGGREGRDAVHGQRADWAVYSGLVDSHFHAKGHGHATSTHYLQSEDMAESMLFILSRPAHVVIDEFMVHPIEQDY